MTGIVVTLVLLLGMPLLLNARSRISRVEHRLRLVEEELRRRLAMDDGEVKAPAQAAAAITPWDGSVQRAAPPEPAAEVEPEPVDLAEPANEAQSPEQPQPELIHTIPEPVLPETRHVAAAEINEEIGEIAQAAPEPKARRSSAGFEELFGRKLPVWAGGITLAIAGVLIVKYAIDIGMFGRIFTPGVQALCGMLFGFGLIGGAEWSHRNRDRVDDPRVSQALSGAGISTLYAALLVAANVYGLISPLAAFAGLAAVTGGALYLSLRHGMPSALLGLAGGLAAPALTVGLDANVPMLATYLGFTIAGLVGVSRAQRWPWLAALALAGGAGWSLWLIAMGQALSVLGALSVGTFVILLAIAAPLFAFRDTGAKLLRPAAAIIGAVQLALLVAIGGFQPLHWGLFILIAAAGQWLAWRERDLAIVPTLGAVLSVVLLLIWPSPEAGWLAAIGLTLAAIHALPLLAQMWRKPARLQRAVELAGISAAIPIVTLHHIHMPWHESNLIGALAALGGGALTLAGAMLGWKVPGRTEDRRLAVLLGMSGGLLSLAAWLIFPHWQIPLWIGAVAAALLFVSGPAMDSRIEKLAAAFAGLAAAAMLLTLPRDFSELLALLGESSGPIQLTSLARWGGLAAIFALLAWKARVRWVQQVGQVGAALLGYGVMSQLAPPSLLPLIAPAAVLGLALWSRMIDWQRLRAAGLALAVVTLGWAMQPLGYWLIEALQSMGGMPMAISAEELAPLAVLRRLLVPAMMLGGGLLLVRENISRAILNAATAIVGTLALVAVHSLYRACFGAAIGSNFVTFGIAQRLIWCALLVGGAWALWQRGGGMLASHAAPILAGAAAMHTLWFSLLLHNPLWDAQAVGPVPIANLLLPLFGFLPACLMLIAQMRPDHATVLQRILQPVLMVMAALFVWATWRHAFHGGLLTDAGVTNLEDIGRSILGIGMAIGFLLWGIHRQLREWRIASLVLMLIAVVKVFLFDASGLEGLLRIASFVALGFSLIGIGWLYSRQLRRDEDDELSVQNAQSSP